MNFLDHPVKGGEAAPQLGAFHLKADVRFVRPGIGVGISTVLGQNVEAEGGGGLKSNQQGQQGKRRQYALHG